MIGLIYGAFMTEVLRGASKGMKIHTKATALGEREIEVYVRFLAPPRRPLSAGGWPNRSRLTPRGTSSKCSQEARSPAFFRKAPATSAGEHRHGPRATRRTKRSSASLHR